MTLYKRNFVSCKKLNYHEYDKILGGSLEGREVKLVEAKIYFSDYIGSN